MSKFLALFSALFVFNAAVQADPITSEDDPALSGAVVIDFEDIAPGEYSSVDLGGATAIANGADLTICDHCGGSGYGDVGQSLNNRNTPRDSFDIVFDTPVSAFGILGGAVNDPWTYTAYDEADNIIEVLQLDDPCCGGYFNGIKAPGISRVNFSTNGDWVVFDNLMFVSEGGNVTIDIKPYDEVNNIITDIENPEYSQNINVAIFGSETFDVTEIKPDSVKFGPARALTISSPGELRDINFDGIDDLKVKFVVAETGLGCGYEDDPVTLVGRINTGGIRFEGSDIVTTEVCENGCHP